jgi:5-methyltetrahydrofolate--homocysteine methyltransferase
MSPAVRSLRDRLAAGDVLVGDGAWGTMLLARGLRPGDPPEALTLAHPDLIESIARLYVEAGADLVTTNTFGGSPLRLRAFGLEAATAAINRAAVEALRRAVGGRALVSGSMGPVGHLLQPYGTVSAAEAAASFARQARALAEAGVDVFCVETMTDLEEARLAVEAARAVAPDVPVIATMTFERTRRGIFTVMGVSVERAAEVLAAAGAEMIGSNCGNGIDAMVEVARAFRAVTAAPLAIQANAGLPESRGGLLVYPESPEQFAAAVPALLAAGVRLVGGCCGTTPAHVRAIRAAVDAARRGPR